MIHGLKVCVYDMIFIHTINGTNKTSLSMTSNMTAVKPV